MKMNRLFRYAAAAVPLAFTTLAAGAVEVFSVNFARSQANEVSGTEGFVPNIAYDYLVGDAWNNVATGGEVTGTATLKRHWHESSVQEYDDDVTVMWVASGFGGNDNADQKYLKGYLDDGNGGASVTITGIPYDVYDVIVYFMYETGLGTTFSPVTVNGISYTWDAAQELAVAGRATWGRLEMTPKLGSNALRINGFSGGTLKIQGGAETIVDSVRARGGIAAVQIVRSTDNIVRQLPVSDFTFGPDPLSTPDGWFYTWNGGVGNNRMIGPEGSEVLAFSGNTAQSGDFDMPDEVTIAMIVNLDNVTSVNDNNIQDPLAVIFSLGRVSRGDATGHATQALVLSKRGNDLYLNNVKKTNGGSVWASPNLCSNEGGTNTGDDNNGHAGRAYCIYPDLPSGYHLIIATQSVHDNQLTLSIDGQTTVVGMTGRISAVERPGRDDGTQSGFRLGACYGDNLAGKFKASTGLAVQSIFAWNQILSEDQKRLLWATYGEAISTPLATADEAPAYGAEGTLFVPDFRVDAETLRFTRGTVQVSGTLAATNAFVQLVDNPVALRIDGGTVTARGLSADRAGSTLTIQNGGTLEIANFQQDYAIPLTVNGGVIRAVDGGEGEGDWTWQGAMTINDADLGAIIDPNGHAIEFTGIASGTGRVSIEDSSAGGDGVVKLRAARTLTGIDVKSGVLNLGVSRPTAPITFAAGTKLVLVETTADGGGDGVGRVPLAITGTLATADVTVYRANGDLVDDVKVEDGPDGQKFITFTATDMPSVKGEVCWYDFEFEDYSLASEGYEGGSLIREGDNGIGRFSGLGAAGDFKDEHTLYTAAESYMGVTYPASWSAAIFATIPAQEDASLMTFGTKNGGLIGLIGGDPAKSEVKLVRTTGDSRFTVLATMTVPHAYTTPHLYVFSKTQNRIEIYLDGELLQPYTSATPITFGNGFQIGSVHGDVGNTGIKRFKATEDTWEDDLYQNSYIEMLRMYDSALSPQALAMLAAEFPYQSPNGVFRRTVSGDATWTSAGAWTKDGEAGTFDAPAEGSVVVLTADADATVTLDGETTLESLEIGGAGSVTFVAADGAKLVNSGATTIKTDVTLPQAVSIPGRLDLAAGSRLVFDWTSYDLPIGAPNGQSDLTGLAEADGDVTFVQPAETKGRTFTFSFNEASEKWVLDVARGPLTLRWIQPGATTWDTDTVWHVDGSEIEAGAIAGDTLIFGDVEGAESVTIAAPAIEAASVTFEAKTTAYTVTGGAITVRSAVTDVADAAVDVSARIDLADGAVLSAEGAGEASFTDVRGTPGRVRLSAPEVTLGSGGTLNLANETVVGADTKVNISGGAVNYTAPGNAFGGSLEVKGGTFTVDAKFTSVKATEDNPILVSGGKLLMTSANNDRDRLPDNAFVVVRGNGTLPSIAQGIPATSEFEVTGNNALPLAARDGKSGVGVTTVICEAGGRFFAHSEAGDHEIHVWDVRLDSGNVLIGRVGNNNTADSASFYIDGGVLHAKGEHSALMRQRSTPGLYSNFLLDVEDGVLSLEGSMIGDVVKAGAGGLIISGNNGGAESHIADIRTGKFYISALDLVVDEASRQRALDLGVLIDDADNTENNNRTKQILLANGTTLDISLWQAPLDLTAFQTAEVPGSIQVTGRVAIDVGDRDVKSGDKILTWAQPINGAFYLLTKKGEMALVKKEDGLYAQAGLFITIR